MANLSYVDCAYSVLTKAYKENGNKSIPMAFPDLLMATGELLGNTDEKTLMEVASKFYTALTTDGRFVIKENNTWVLREHELFADVHIDMNEVYSDDDDENVKEMGDDNENEEDGDASSENDDEKEEEDEEAPVNNSADEDDDI